MDDAMYAGRGDGQQTSAALWRWLYSLVEKETGWRRTIAVAAMPDDRVGGTDSLDKERTDTVGVSFLDG